MNSGTPAASTARPRDGQASRWDRAALRRAAAGQGRSERPPERTPPSPDRSETTARVRASDRSTCRTKRPAPWPDNLPLKSTLDSDLLASPDHPRRQVRLRDVRC